MYRILFSLFLVLGLASNIFAQSNAKPSVILEYFDDESQIVILDIDGYQIQDIYLGMPLIAGKIQTKGTTAELRIQPNGTIIKLARNTQFQINNLPNANSQVNDFTVLAGKIRTVAAKASGNSYRFNTPTAVCGVRGTDFGLEVLNGIERLLVQSGVVEFAKKTGETLRLGAGQGADARAQSFIAAALTTQELSDFFGPLSFNALDPSQVPQDQTVTLASTTTSTTIVAANSNVVDTNPVDTSGGAENEAKSSASAPSAADSELLKALKKALGLEIGSITIDGDTYGKLIVTPKIDTPDFKMGFYLPVIYQNDLFDIGNWYKPNGNNEWSFGTDQGEDVLLIIGDVLTDLVLKIKFLQLYEAGDPFFIGLGSLEAMTLGHGFLIGEYANDLDFPSIRRVGLNIGFDVGGFALEALTNDLARPEIFGLRMLVRPAHPDFNFGIGLSAALDINPASSLPAIYQTQKDAQPMFFNYGVDFDLPVFKDDSFGLLIYADVGGLIPIVANRYTTTGGTIIEPGFVASQVVGLVDGELRWLNWGFAGGIKGKILILDYKLEFQTYNGNFIANFYGNAYDRVRGQRAQDVLASLDNTSFFAQQRSGIYGELGVNLFDVVYLKGGYKWPWLMLPDGFDISNPDEFLIEVNLNKEMIPYGIDVGLQIKRSYFKELFIQPEKYMFLDAYTTFSGTVDVPLGDFFSIRATVGTALKKDSEGNIVVDTNGIPQVAPTFTLETVF